MTHSLRIVISILLATFLVSSHAIAQSQGQYGLDTVAIATSRISQSPTQSGRHVTILDAEMIEQLPVRSFDELLRYLPGVEVQSRGPAGVQADIIIRGSTFSQVLMLVDGMRLNDPLTGHFNNNLPVGIDEIERIEILKGPAAAEWGPDAVGGVVHVITKTFAAAHNSSSESEYAVRLAGGEFGLVSGNAGFYLNRKHLSAGASVLINRADGQPLLSGQNGDFNLQTYAGSIGWRFAPKWYAMVRVGYDFRRFNAQYFYTRSPFDESREQVSNLWGQFHLSRQSEFSRTLIQIGTRINRDSFLFNPAFPANIHRTRFLNAQVNHEYQLSPGVILAVGLQSTLRDIESTDRGDHADQHFGGWVSARVNPLTDLNINVALRGDYDSNYGFEALPQLAVSWRKNILNLRASTGRSIRAADYTERFISTNLAGPLAPGRNVGNPGLQAEVAWNHEIGADLIWPAGLRLSGSLFLRQGRNLIDYRPATGAEIGSGNVDPGANYLFADNIEQVDVQGIEIEAGYRRKWGDWRIELLAGYLLIDSRGPDSVVSKYISNSAGQQFNVATSVQWQFLGLSINGLWRERDADFSQEIGADLTPRYTVWNVRLSGFFLANKLEVFAQVDNVFDEKYADILGAQMPGRWFAGGITWRFRTSPANN